MKKSLPYVNILQNAIYSNQWITFNPKKDHQCFGFVISFNAGSNPKTKSGDPGGKGKRWFFFHVLDDSKKRPKNVEFSF